jgi:hypothetical protein
MTEVKTLGELKNGVYEFTPLYALNSRGQTRFSNIFIRFIVGDGEIKDSNWDLDNEEQVDIESAHLDKSEEIPEDVIAALWTETGQEGGKTLRSSPTYIRSGKNLGKKNATNVLTQAISDGRSKWNKNKRKSGYVEDKAQLTVVQSGRIKPMALHELPPQAEDEKFDITGTTYWNEGDPMYIGHKSDGNRMMAAKGDLWGRGGDTPPNPLTHIREQLAPLFVKYPKIILDGEIYKHGIEHQLINGTYMNAKTDASQLDYVVFDAVLPDRDTPFEKRVEFLRELLGEQKNHPNIILNDVELVSTSDEIETKYKAYLADGYEGAVLRKPDSKYDVGIRKEKRSKTALKLKPVFDKEFEITGFKDGKGKDSGALIWILKMPDSNKTFFSRPKMTIDERRKLFDHMKDNFDSDYKGKPMRILYGDTTKDGMPRFSRAVGVRLMRGNN